VTSLSRGTGLLIHHLQGRAVTARTGDGSKVASHGHDHEAPGRDDQREDANPPDQNGGGQGGQSHAYEDQGAVHVQPGPELIVLYLDPVRDRVTLPEDETAHIAARVLQIVLGPSDQVAKLRRQNTRILRVRVLLVNETIYPGQAPSIDLIAPIPERVGKYLNFLARQLRTLFVTAGKLRHDSLDDPAVDLVIAVKHSRQRIDKSGSGLSPPPLDDGVFPAYVLAGHKSISKAHDPAAAPVTFECPNCLEGKGLGDDRREHQQRYHQHEQLERMRG
jgi:hypothetical protein